MRQWVGTPYPLGASYDGTGTNFSIFSSVAEGVFSASSVSELARRTGVEMPIAEAVRAILHEGADLLLARGLRALHAALDLVIDHARPDLGEQVS